MLFNSLTFLVFFPVVFALYWLLGSQRRKLQNALLLVASFYFYSCWDWRFMFLLLFSVCLDYYTGLRINQSRSQDIRRMWMLISVCINLGFLMFFKYYNFFAESLQESLAVLGYQADLRMLKIILPVGISFYTFHGLSYIFDIYYKRISSETNFIDYALFVSFFPLLVAGPIERATHLLPQIKKPRTFDYTRAVDGCRQILWGFFKKIVIADSCAPFVNEVFGNHQAYGNGTLALAAVLFAVQIYGDFSGYSDIAIGTARLFGVELLKNFSFPYFSRDIAEFWRRWHISLSSWFKDYLYIPLGGSRGGMWKKIRNIFVIFLVSGFWHGANWTFLIWGGLHALYYLPSMLLGKNRQHPDIVAKNRFFPNFKEISGMLITFVAVVFAWIFFRADSLSHAFSYIGHLFSFGTELPYFSFSKKNLLFILLFFGMEWLGRKNNHALETFMLGRSRVLRYGGYYFLMAIIIYYATISDGNQEFIYFQF